MSHIKLSNETKHFLQNIGKYFFKFDITPHKFYNKIYQNIKKCHYCKYDYSITENIIHKNNNSIINFCKQNPFIHSTILKTIVSNTLKHIHIVYKNNNIHLYVSDNNIPNINKLLHIIDFMRSLSKSNKALSLYIFSTDNKKTIYQNNSILGPEHVNSGSCIRGEMITIWRKEEIYKVLIHELIHFLELDFTTCIGKEYFFTRFGVTPVKVFESFTDSLAIIIHTIYISYHTNIDYITLLKIELNFVIFQAAKITNHYNSNCYSIDNNYSCINDLKGKIKQQTDVLSYFILKAAIMLNINTLIDFFDNNIYFAERDEEFIKIIDDSLNSILFNITINYYKKLHSTITDLYVKNSLRMTMLELYN